MYKTTFAELKTRAKDVLKSNYWYSFGVCILVSLITSLGTSVATVTNMVNSDAGSAGTSISAVLQILITLFVTFPLSVGSCRFFIKATVNAPNVYDLFFPYKNNLGNVIGINVFVAVVHHTGNYQIIPILNDSLYPCRKSGYGQTQSI